MNDCQSSLLSQGDASIAWIATHLRHDWLTPLMIFFSELGQVGAILFTLGFSYWLWNKRYARALIYGLFLNIFINLWVKNIVKECRPPPSFWLENVDSYSFPSGHSQVGVYLWVGLALYIKEKWISLTCVLIGLFIALSRTYLGVHYPQDIIAGALLGIAVLILTTILEKRNFDPFSSKPLWQKAMLMLLLLATYNYFVQDIRSAQISSAGACFGFWLGCQFENRLLNFIPPRKFWPFISQGLLGGVGLILFWKGGDLLRHQLSNNIATNAKYIQYFLLGLWISLGAPLLFKVSKPKR